MECVTASELTLVAVSALTCPGLSQQSSGQVACLYEFKVHAPEKLHTDVYESGHSLSPVLVPFFFNPIQHTVKDYYTFQWKILSACLSSKHYLECES